MAKAARTKKKPTSKKAIEAKGAAKRNRDWEVNNELISEAFFNSILKNKKFPTYAAIAKQLGMNERTVRRHLQDEEMFEDLKVKMRAIKNKALLTLAMKAIKGDSHHWTRLFFEVTDEIKNKDSNITIFINGKPAGASN
jgi:AcrR family transcriptional regulator